MSRDFYVIDLEQHRTLFFASTFHTDRMEKKGVYRLYVRFHQIIMNLSTKLFVQCSSPLIKHSKNRFEKKCLQILQFSQVLLGIFNFFCCVVVTTIMSNITDDKRKIAHRHFSIRWI